MTVWDVVVGVVVIISIVIIVYAEKMSRILGEKI